LSIAMEGAARAKEYRLITVNGESTESYNDIGVEQVRLTRGEWKPVTGNVLNVTLQPHSANVIQLKDIA